MELEFERDAIDGYETLAEVTLCQEETQETIVPDACPDILRIVDVCGQALLNGKQVKEGSASISGMVRLVVLYQPEGGGGLCRMESTVPFNCQTEIAGLTATGRLLAHPRLKKAEARVLNPRKVLLRVELAVELSACQPIHREVCRGATGGEEDGICQKQLQCEHYYLADVEEKPFVFQDQIRLKSSQGEIPQLLDCHIQTLCTESKRIGNKLLFKGTAETELLLMESSGGLSTCRESLPFSQVIELPNNGEEGDCRVSVDISALHCAPDLDDRQCIQVELELLAQAQIYHRQTITLLQDLYSTSKLTDCDMENQTINRRGEVSVFPQSIRELFETGDSIRSVVNSNLYFGELSQQREGQELVLSVEANLSVLYLDENELVQCARKSVTVSSRIPYVENTRCSCHCVCPGEVYAAPSAGGIEVRFNVEFHCLTICTEKILSVASAKLGEERGSGEGERPSMVLRLAAPGEELWDIAKAYGTTMEQIVQANELDSEQLPAGMMLLIPSIR